MPPYELYKPHCKLSAKIRWNRLARISLSGNFEAIGVYATSGTPVVRKDEDGYSSNDAYYDESDRGIGTNEFDVRISRIQTAEVAELANVLRLWCNESASRHVSIRSHNGATYRIELVKDEDLVSVLKNARLIDVVERQAKAGSLTKKINTFLLGG
jgi:hypothetical protein